MAIRAHAAIVAILAASALSWAAPAGAKTAVTCGGVALLGAAELLCSHVDPTAPQQFCTYRWELTTASNQIQLVQGAFTIAPGQANVEVYQGGGFQRAASNAIILCQGRKSAP